MIMVGACYSASVDEDASGNGGNPNAGSPSKGGSTGKGGAGGSTSGGSSSKGGSSSAGTSGGSGEAGAPAGGSGGAPTFSCPASPPVDGSECTPPAGSDLFLVAHCSWGDDPRAICRTMASCNQGLWYVTEPTSPPCANDPLPAACPVTPPEQASVCDSAALQCWYQDGTRCSCSDCEGGSAYPICQTIDPPEWSCITPPAGCPNPPPQAGEACDQPDLQCGLDCELTITCAEGAWRYGANECPICAAPDTAIATPSGPRAIASLRVGELVYSVDHGAIVAVPIARTGSTPVVNHRVVRLVLNDGAVLEMSPGHPTADGRVFSDLLRGGTLDEQHTVALAELVPYQHERTYDILPASSTGSYFAAGARVGSTLSR